MADLTITPASLKPGAGANPIRGIASNAIVAGDVVCVLADGTITQADSNAGPPNNTPAGIAACSAPGAGQYVMYVAIDNDFTIGATVVSGTVYCLSANPGKICPTADLASGVVTSIIGVGKGTTKLSVNIFASGQTV